MKEELESFYKNYHSKFAELITTFPKKSFNGPLLISPNELYVKQNRKLLVIGQETNGWTGLSETVEPHLELYKEFNVGYSYNSPFWNITRKLEENLNLEPFSCSWSNINRFDEDCGPPSGESLKIIERFDEIILTEIQILKPDIIIFFTGPKFEYRIKNLFENIEFNEVESFQNMHLSRLYHKLLPINTYRTYHPKYLRLRKLEEKFVNYFKTI